MNLRSWLFLEVTGASFASSESCSASAWPPGESRPPPYTFLSLSPGTGQATRAWEGCVAVPDYEDPLEDLWLPGV